MTQQEARSAPPHGLGAPAILIIAALSLALLWALWTRGGSDKTGATPSLAASSEAKAVDPSPVARPANPVAMHDNIQPLTPEEQKRHVQSQFAAYETLFRNDGVDAAWSMQSEKDIIEAASEPALTALGVPTSYNARCAAHLCKMTMEFNSRSEADDWAQFYPVGMGGTLSSVQSTIDVGPDGKSTLIIFGTRKGFQKMLHPPQPEMMPK